MKYQVYGEVVKEFYHISHPIFGVDGVAINTEYLLRDNYYLKYNLIKKAIFEKYSFIKEIDIDREISIGKKIMIEDKIFIIKDIVYNCDKDCFSILTDYKVQHIPIDESVEKIFLEKVKEYEESERARKEEILSNTIVGKLGDLKNKIKEIFN